MKPVATATTLLAALKAATDTKAAAAATAAYRAPKLSRKYGCYIDGCARLAVASNLCNAHYIRKKKGAPLDAVMRTRRKESTCSECGEGSTEKGGWGLCQRHYRRDRYVALKDAAIAAMGGQCARCEGTFHRAVFDFHHIGEKLESPSSMFLNRSIRALSQELAKCILLCANCHRMEHRDELR